MSGFYNSDTYCMANNMVCRGRQTAFLHRLKPVVPCLFLMEVQRRFAEIYLALDPAARTQFVDFVDELLCSDFDEFDIRAWAQTIA